jgi:hypothetical protein
MENFKLTLQNSTPSNKNFLGVVVMNNDRVGPKIASICVLTNGIKVGISCSAACMIDCAENNFEK